jgi:hypothetical protein
MLELLNLLRAAVAAFNAAESGSEVRSALNDVAVALWNLLQLLAKETESEALARELKTVETWTILKPRLGALRVAAKIGRSCAFQARRKVIEESGVPGATFKDGVFTLRKARRTPKEIALWSCSLELERIDLTLGIMIECVDLPEVTPPTYTQYKGAVDLAKATLISLLEVYGETDGEKPTDLAVNYLPIHQFWDALDPVVREIVGAYFMELAKPFRLLMQRIRDDRQRTPDQPKKHCHASLSNEAGQILEHGKLPKRYQ